MSHAAELYGSSTETDREGKGRPLGSKARAPPWLRPPPAPPCAALPPTGSAPTQDGGLPGTCPRATSESTRRRNCPRARKSPRHAARGTSSWIHPPKYPRTRPSNSQSASSGSRERQDQAVPRGVERHPAPFTDRALHPGKQAQVRRTEGSLRPPRLQPLVSPGAKQSAAAWGARLCGVFTSQGSEPGHQEGERHAQVTKQSVTGLGLAPEVQLSGHPHRAGRARSLTVQGCAGAHGQRGSGWRHRLDQGASSGDEDVLVNRPFLTALDLL